MTIPIFHPADSLSLSLFYLFSLVMLVVCARTLFKLHRNFFFCYVLYIVVFSALVSSGLVLGHIIPLAPLLFTSVLALALFFAFSKFGTQVSTQYSLALLIGLQSFRLPLELILHHWATIGTIPPTMTWTGQNWDVVTGLLSLLTCAFINRSQKLAWTVQIIGFVLLLNVLRVVVLSSPFPFSWPLENPIQLVLYFPYALIGPLFVGTALFLHLIVFRKLLTTK